MRAIQIDRCDGPEVLKVVDLPRPEPGVGQVLIRVKAAGVNFADTLMRAGTYVSAYTLPAVPGSEIAGVIEAVGTGVSDFSPGARVVAVLAAAKILTGGYADFCVADAEVTAPLPDEISFDVGAAFLVQGLTALWLVREANPAGRDVLITAAGGGVGSLLIRMARHAGARTIAAAASTTAKRELALFLGADLALDYADLARTAPDLVYESVGGSVLPRCLEVLSCRGEIVIYGALSLIDFFLDADGLKKLMFFNQSLRGFTSGGLLQMNTLGADLGELHELAASKKLSPVLSHRFRLADAAVAHAALGARKSVGKLVLNP